MLDFYFLIILNIERIYSLNKSECDCVTVNAKIIEAFSNCKFVSFEKANMRTICDKFFLYVNKNVYSNKTIRVYVTVSLISRAHNLNVKWVSGAYRRNSATRCGFVVCAKPCRMDSLSILSSASRAITPRYEIPNSVEPE